LQYTFKKRF